MACSLSTGGEQQAAVEELAPNWQPKWSGKLAATWSGKWRKNNNNSSVQLGDKTLKEHTHTNIPITATIFRHRAQPLASASKRSSVARLFGFLECSRILLCSHKGAPNPKGKPFENQRSGYIRLGRSPVRRARPLALVSSTRSAARPHVSLPS